jgi:hypothetical protein
MTLVFNKSVLCVILFLERKYFLESHYLVILLHCATGMWCEHYNLYNDAAFLVHRDCAESLLILEQRFSNWRNLRESRPSLHATTEPWGQGRGQLRLDNNISCPPPCDFGLWGSCL